MNNRQKYGIGILDTFVRESKHRDFQNLRLPRIVKHVILRHFPKQDAATILVMLAKAPEFTGQFVNIVSPSLLIRHQNLYRVPNVALPVRITAEPLRVRVALDQRYDH